MCEWLLRGEWCDVKLLCAGRIFNAHKAVLATVSPFLRKLLLTCSDELDTFIVLPDFDVDAMSSVLYYIYNGEVSIEVHKREKFFEVIKTLQIFVELQYLPESDKQLNYLHKRESECRDIDVFILGRDSDCNNKMYINLKKGQPVKETLLYFNKCVDYPRHKRNIEDDFFKVQLPEGRQKSCILRDIEKYPQNGYCNGVAERVLAISNSFYLEPSSKPLMNANDVFRGDKTLSETSRIEHVHTNLQLSQNVHKAYVTKLNTNLLTDYHNGTRSAQNLWTTHMPLLPVPLLPEVKDNNVLQKHITPSLDLSTQSISLDQATYCNRLFFTEEFLHNCSDMEKSNMHLDRSKITERSNKVICNQVLQNPWCPRQPNNYRAFKRKAPSNSTQNVVTELKGSNYDFNACSDSNNNIKKSDTPLTESPMDKKSYQDPEKMSAAIFTQDQASASDSIFKKESTGRYTCEECSKTFSQLRNYKYHMSIHRGTKEFAATCTICSKYFNDRGYLSSHMKIHRNRKEYKCSQCPKSFNQRVAYNMHVRIHTGVKPHVCDECGKAFSRKMLLKQHYRTHSGERPYACPHCDKRFADRSNMTLHLRLHTGVKPFSCTMCPKSFTKKHHLKSHLNFHTGAKPYSCPRCNLAFTQSSNMRTHLKKCTAPEVGTSNL